MNSSNETASAGFGVGSAAARTGTSGGTFASMSLSFEWDPAKARSNLQKHGVSFGEAATVLADPLSITIADPDHSHEEERFLVLGQSQAGRLLIVLITERGDFIRLIGAREMTAHERRAYEYEIGR